MKQKFLAGGILLVFLGRLILVGHDFRGLVEKWLPGDEAGLAAGILLGGNNLLSSQAKEAYRRVGMLHVIAASGYNVTVIAGVALAVGLKLMSRRWVMLFVILSVVLYMYLAGMTASVVRAGVMAILTYIALMFGRPVDAYWILGLVCGVMLLFRPAYISDIGFLLSVTATVGVLMSKPVDFKSDSKIWRLFVFEDLRTTLWAQVFTTPIILHYFGDLSLIAPVSNALLLWLVPIIMQVMLMALGVGVIWPPAGQLISFLAYPLLRGLNLGVQFFSNLPMSSMNVGKLPWVWVGAYYLLLVIVINVKYLISNRWLR